MRASFGRKEVQGVTELGKGLTLDVFCYLEMSFGTWRERRMQSVLNLNTCILAFDSSLCDSRFLYGDFWVGLQLTFLLSLMSMTVSEVWS